MLCNRSPRRWATVYSSLFLLTMGALGMTGGARASVSLDDAAPAQAAQSASAATPTGAPVIVSVPFERTERGELLPSPEAVKALLEEAARNPGGLLVIRPGGDLAGFDRGPATGQGSVAPVTPSATDAVPPHHSTLDEGSAALLRIIESLRQASPQTRVSVLGLPIERSRLADAAAANSGAYARLLGDLDAFVSTRGLLHGRDALEERAWLKGALPSAVRFAQGRPILFRTPAGWQQRSLPIESLEGHDDPFAGDSVEADRAPHVAPAARIAEHSEPPLDEAGLPATGTVEDSWARRVADSGRPALEAPPFSGRPDRLEAPSDPDGAADPLADSLADARLSDSGGTILDDNAIIDSGAITGDDPLPALERETAGGGAAAPPSRSLAIVPRALRTFAPLAIGGYLLDPRGFRSATRSESPAVDQASEVSGPSTGSRSPAPVRSGASPSSNRSASSGSSAAATAPAGGKGSTAAPSAPATPRSASSSGASATAPATRSPSTTPPRPTTSPAPPVLPVAGSPSSPQSPAPAAPPPLNPVIPITPPTSSGSIPSTPPQPPPPSAPAPPRDWSTIPANVGNEHSKIGTHLPGTSYYGSGVPFANLIYSTIQDYERIPFTNKNIWGLDRFTSWSGSPYFTADGWPIRNDNGAFSPSNPCSIYLVLNGTERVWSVLGLTGGFVEPPTATPVFNSKGEPTNKATYTLPDGIAGRTFTATVTCYWEGTGKVTLGRADRPVTVSSVNFTGPHGDGPFGDGPRTMSRSSITATGLSQIILSIVESSASDPVRNIVVLVSNVTDAATGEVVYAGFDHTTYQPFQLYPQFIESHRHFSHIRSLATQWQHHEPTPSRGIFEDTGFTLEISESGEAEMPIVTTGWTRSQPSAPGFEKGFAAINRPTNICFGNSLRAYIEVCNQLDADLWWCHPVPTVAVGTRHGDGSITYARQRGRNTADPNQVGRLLLDEAYANGFADTIEQHLKPGLKVYSEWANEVWNWSSTYWHGTSWAWTFALRAIADVERGGDGGLWYANRNLAAPAIYAGVSLGTNSNYAQTAFSAAASALLAEAIRDRLGDSDREIVCVAAGQSASVARSANSLGQFWAAMPKLFKQLDAVAHAPYRSWWGNGSAFDTQLANDGFESVWQEIDSVRGGLLPYANLPSLTLRDDSYWGTRSRSKGGAYWGYPFQRAWKDLALDRPDTLTVAGSLWYQRAFTPPGWNSSQRRWNLDLLTYEGGNHHIPVSAGAKLESYAGAMHPSYREFTIRYMEMIFGHGPKGLTRDPASASEEGLYRPGMVPMGVVENAEPLHDGFTFLTTIIEPSFRHGMFWGLQWWNGQLDAPQAEGAKEAVRLGVGTDRWWE